MACLLVGVAAASITPRVFRPLVDRIDTGVPVIATIFLMTLTLESRFLWQAILRPWPVLWAIVLSYGFVPLSARIVGSSFLDTDGQVGLL